MYVLADGFILYNATMARARDKQFVIGDYCAYARVR